MDSNMWTMRDGKLIPIETPDFIPQEGEYNLIEVLVTAGFDTDRRFIPGRGVLNDTIILEGSISHPGGYTYVILTSPLNNRVFMVFLKDFGEFIEAINHLGGLLRLNYIPTIDDMPGSMPGGCPGCTNDDDDDNDWYPPALKPSEN